MLIKEMAEKLLGIVNVRTTDIDSLRNKNEKAPNVSKGFSRRVHEIQKMED